MIRLLSNLQPRAGSEYLFRPGQDRGPAFYILGIFCIKLVLFLLDPVPKFFLGDSGWYIGTAFLDWIPLDRSFTYGYLIRFLTFGSESFTSKSFTPLVASQVLASAASTVLLVYALKKYFSIKPSVAYILGILCAVEPIQLLYERHVMTETFSLFCFALYMVASFEYLSSRRLGHLCLSLVLGTALITLRVSFLPLILVNTVFLPVLASFDPFLRRRKTALSETSSSSSWSNLFRVQVAHLVIAVLLTGLLHNGYKQAFSKFSGYPPAYNAADGYFLVAIWAPAVEPVDFPYPGLRAEVFGNLSYDHRDRSNRTEQLFADGGLVENIRSAIPGPDGNKAAKQTAMNALKRDPAAVITLSLRTLRDYFHLDILREGIANDLAMDDDQVSLYRECQETFGHYVGFPTPVGQPQPMTLTKSYYKVAIPWYWFLIFTPILCIPALFRAKDRLVRVMMIEAGLAIYASVAIACFITVVPVVRYLHPVSWLVFFPLAVLVNGAAEGQRPRLYAGEQT